MVASQILGPPPEILGLELPVKLNLQKNILVMIGITNPLILSDKSPKFTLVILVVKKT